MPLDEGPDKESKVIDAFAAYLNARQKHMATCRALHAAKINLIKQLADADCLAELRSDLS